MAGYRHFSQPNSLACYGYFDVAAAQSLMARSYRQLFQAICPQESLLLEVGLFRPDRYSPGLANLLGVGMHYTDPFTELPPPYGPGTLNPDLRLQAWPDGKRGWLVGAAQHLTEPEVTERLLAPDFDPGQCVYLTDALPGPQEGQAGPVGAFQWEKYDCNDLAVMIDSPAACWFLLNDTLAPGWSAQVDGQAAPILPADLAFRAVYLEPGRHRLTMAYRPRALTWGLPCQLFCLVILCVGWFRSRLQ